MNQRIIRTALAELASFEGAVHQFGQRARMFLQAMPADLPQPCAVSPSLPTKNLRSPYLHLTFSTPDEVASWAAWMGATLERTDQYGHTFVSATANLAGLPLYVGCMTALPQSEQQSDGDR